MAWKDVSIAQYKKIAALKADEDWHWNALAILNGTTYEDIVSRPLNETMKLSREFNRWAIDAPIIHPVKKKYEINGKKYEFTGYPDKISTAVYIDFYNGERKVPENLTDMLALVLIPEGHKYNDGYDLEEVKKEIDEYFNIEDALSVCDFFTSLSQVLLRRAMRQSKRLLKKAKKDGVQTEEAEKQLKEYRRIVGLK